MARNRWSFFYKKMMNREKLEEEYYYASKHVVAGFGGNWKKNITARKKNTCV